MRDLPLMVFVHYCRYGLVTEQKKGSYKYFMDTGDSLEVVEPKTLYVDEVSLPCRTRALAHTRTQNEEREVDKTKIVYGMQLGAPPEDDEDAEFGIRAVSRRSKVGSHLFLIAASNLALGVGFLYRCRGQELQNTRFISWNKAAWFQR